MPTSPLGTVSPPYTDLKGILLPKILSILWKLSTFIFSYNYTLIAMSCIALMLIHTLYSVLTLFYIDVITFKSDLYSFYVAAAA